VGADLLAGDLVVDNHFVGFELRYGERFNGQRWVDGILRLGPNDEVGTDTAFPSWVSVSHDLGPMVIR
jgi:hypothetical protein